MKRQIRKYKLGHNQRTLCEHMSKEDVKRIDADARRLEELKKLKIKQKENAEWREFWARQNAEEILKIRARRVIDKPNYIISSASTKAKPKE
jgi:hypothetical protein